MDDKVVEARQRAEAVFGHKAPQDDLKIIEQQRAHEQKEAEKLQRLRSLRLAKEAADREERALAGVRKRGRPKRVAL